MTWLFLFTLMAESIFKVPWRGSFDLQVKLFCDHPRNSNRSSKINSLHGNERKPHSSVRNLPKNDIFLVMFFRNKQKNIVKYRCKHYQKECQEMILSSIIR